MTRTKILAVTITAFGLLLPLASLHPVNGSQRTAEATMSLPVSAEKRFTVVVDAGHGGEDAGAVGLDGTREKDINIEIAQKLHETLTKQGVRVVMTRTGDTSLPTMARPAFVATNQAQYFVSIHCDGIGAANSHSGVAAYYHGASLTGQRLADDVLRHITATTTLPAYGLLSDTVKFPTGFGVLRGSPVPAVLVECGFMNSTHDLTMLRRERTQQQIAEGIAAGLEQFNSQYVPLREKIDSVAAVHAHNTLVVQAWNMFARDTVGVYEEATRRRTPEAIVSVIAPEYTLNGQPQDARQAARKLRVQLHRYGVDHNRLQVVTADMNPAYNRATVLTKGSENLSAFSRRDVWTKTPAGWRLTASVVM